MTDFSTITACGESCAGCKKKLDGICKGSSPKPLSFHRIIDNRHQMR